MGHGFRRRRRDLVRPRSQHHPPDGYDAGFGAIAPSPVSPLRVYGLTFGSQGERGTVYSSNDGGLSWKIVNQPNRDGSGRFYRTQWFEKAALERHPENRNPNFRILLRLLGKDLLIKRGWQ